MLPRKYRLSRSQCALVQRRGRTIEGTYLRVKRLASEGLSGISIVVPKSVLKRSVDRHRVKRRISEALRSLLTELPGGHMLVTAKRGSETRSVENLRQEIVSLATR